jgi:hypothetical protein
MSGRLHAPAKEPPVPIVEEAGMGSRAGLDDTVIIPANNSVNPNSTRLVTVCGANQCNI